MTRSMPLIDYHAHAAPMESLESARARGFMPFPVSPPMQLWSADLHLREMDAAGIDKRILSVPPILYGYELEPGDQVGHCRALNDWLFEFAQASHFEPMLILPLGSPWDVLVELDRCRSRGGKHFAIGTHVNGVDLDSAVDDEVWSAFSELNGYVMMHPWKSRDGARLNGFRLGNYLGNPFETAAAAARLISAGIVERYQRLPIMLAHGGGALPYLLSRMEHGWIAASGGTMEGAGPTELARRFYFDTVVFGEEQLRFLERVVGPDRILPGTDSPFDMGVLGRPPLLASGALMATPLGEASSP